MRSLKMENRNFTRVDFSGCASILYDDNVVWGEVDNLSLQGFCIKTPLDLPLNIPFEVTIHHSHNTSIHMNASAVHCGKAGTGMKIHEFDLNTFVSLRKVIASKCHDQRLVMNEAYKMLHCIH
jgi:hypothetical protein